MKASTYKDLIVWQKAITLAVEIYALTDRFPTEEKYGLTSQMRRASVSIASNITEGKLRGHPKELRQFLSIAFGAGGELETQIEIAKKIYPLKEADYATTESLLGEIMKMLNTLLSRSTSA